MLKKSQNQGQNPPDFFFFFFISEYLFRRTIFDFNIFNNFNFWKT